MKTWSEMTDEEKGVLLVAWQRGDAIEYSDHGYWIEDDPLWCGSLSYRVKPKEATYEGECWAYHYLCVEPALITFNADGDCTHGTWKATHIDGKPVKIVWEADK